MGIGGAAVGVGGWFTPLASDKSRAVRTALSLSSSSLALVGSGPARGSPCAELPRRHRVLDLVVASSFTIAEESLDLDRSGRSTAPAFEANVLTPGRLPEYDCALLPTPACSALLVSCRLDAPSRTDASAPCPSSSDDISASSARLELHGG